MKPEENILENVGEAIEGLLPKETESLIITNFSRQNPKYYTLQLKRSAIRLVEKSPTANQDYRYDCEDQKLKLNDTVLSQEMYAAFGEKFGQILKDVAAGKVLLFEEAKTGQKKEGVPADPLSYFSDLPNTLEVTQLSEDDLRQIVGGNVAPVATHSLAPRQFLSQVRDGASAIRKGIKSIFKIDVKPLSLKAFGKELMGALRSMEKDFKAAFSGTSNRPPVREPVVAPPTPAPPTPAPPERGSALKDPTKLGARYLKSRRWEPASSHIGTNVVVDKGREARKDVELLKDRNGLLKRIISMEKDDEGKTTLRTYDIVNDDNNQVVAIEVFETHSEKGAKSRRLDAKIEKERAEIDKILKAYEDESEARVINESE